MTSKRENTFVVGNSGKTPCKCWSVSSGLRYACPADHGHDHDHDHDHGYMVPDMVPDMVPA
jgi:hypothetical protein